MKTSNHLLRHNKHDCRLFPTIKESEESGILSEAFLWPSHNPVPRSPIKVFLSSDQKKSRHLLSQLPQWRSWLPFSPVHL